MIIPINLTMTFDTLPDDIERELRELDLYPNDPDTENIQFTDVNAPLSLKTYLKEHIVDDLIEQFNQDSLDVLNYTIYVHRSQFIINAIVRVISTRRINDIIIELNRLIISICQLGSNSSFFARINFPGNDEYLRPSYVDRMYKKMFGRGRKSKRRRDSTGKRKTKR